MAVREFQDVPEEFARGVAAEMLRLRGWRGLDAAPSEVHDDVFATMGRHDGVYVAGYAAGIAPAAVAQTIQDREWDRARA